MKANKKKMATVAAVFSQAPRVGTPQAVIDSLTSGKPLDPEIARRVHERAQRIREEIFQQHGLLDLGVPLIRELRGELPNP